MPISTWKYNRRCNPRSLWMSYFIDTAFELRCFHSARGNVRPTPTSLFPAPRARRACQIASANLLQCAHRKCKCFNRLRPFGSSLSRGSSIQQCLFHGFDGNLFGGSNSIFAARFWILSSNALFESIYENSAPSTTFSAARLGSFKLFTRSLLAQSEVNNGWL